MADEPYVNPFQKVHQMVKATKDRSRENIKLEAERREKDAQEKAVAEGYDRA